MQLWAIVGLKCTNGTKEFEHSRDSVDNNNQWTFVRYRVKREECIVEVVLSLTPDASERKIRFGGQLCTAAERMPHDQEIVGSNPALS